MSVTNYQRFKPHTVFGLIGTGNSIAFITRLSQVRRYAAVTACQLIVIWDIRKQVQVACLQCPDVSGLARILSVRPPTDGGANNTHLAAGYSTGHVIVFSIKENESIDPTVFAGHRGAVTALAWDSAGMRLASAGTDGEIVIWDVVSERGVVRLRGHKGIVTRVLFLQARDVLVSSGKDGFVKFWDISTGHCFRTLTPLTAEVWDIALLRDDAWLVIGGNDAILQVWGLTFADNTVKKEDSIPSDTKEGNDDDPMSKFFCLDTEGETPKDESIIPETDDIKLPENEASILALELVGRLQRSKASRVLGLCSAGSVLACYGKHSSLDLFRVLSEEEVQEKVRKRVKKTRKRLRESGAAETETAVCTTPQLADAVRLVATLPVHSRIATVCPVQDRDTVYLATLYTDNSLAVMKWDAAAGKQETSLADNTLCLLSTAGHRTEVRGAQFSSVGDQLVTLSNECIKTWHRAEYECQCTNTAPLTTHVRTMLLAPGDRHVVLGTSTGHLQLLELASGAMLEDILAYTKTSDDDGDQGEGEITALVLTADCKGFLSGGTDKIVRCWKFELVSDDSAGRRLSLQATRESVTMADIVTCVQCSADGRFVAVATIDNKETLYYADTMKLHQELYGKSLPSVCMSFTTDGDLLVTGSKDTALRIYGTDFGDMRRLIKNAHTGGVTCVQFQGNTRLFFSAGHDGNINYWDAANFQRIMTLRGHTGIVRCMTLPPKGNWVATGGQDFSLRLWERTDELLELDEEREEERRRKEEEEEGEGLMAGQKRHVEGESRDAEAVRASKPTYRTEEAVDMILAGLNMYQQHLSNPDTAPHYLMLSYNLKDPLQCFNEMLHRIKPSELEEAIVQLELPQILGLLVVLCRLGSLKQLTEVSVRVALVAVRTNLTQLVGCRTAQPLLRSLDVHVYGHTKLMQDVVGFNIAGLKQCVVRHEKRSETQMFAEAMDRLSINKKRRKRKESATRRAMISLK